MSIQTIDTPALEAQLAAARTQLLDVRLADDFAASHLPGAVNNCVLEVAFAGRLPDTAPDKEAPVIVYGAWADSHESRVAADKLERLGYQKVYDYRDGLAGWKKSGGELAEGPPLPDDPPASHGHFEVDLAESRIEWTGRNLLNKHWGTIASSDRD